MDSFVDSFAWRSKASNLPEELYLNTQMLQPIVVCCPLLCQRYATLIKYILICLTHFSVSFAFG